MQETLPGYGTLPSNAEFVQANTENCAVGLGMLSQALNTTTAKSHSFKHYLFMNSYARGPFLPAYLVVSCTATVCFLASRYLHNNIPQSLSLLHSSMAALLRQSDQTFRKSIVACTMHGVSANTEHYVPKASSDEACVLIALLSL